MRLLFLPACRLASLAWFLIPGLAMSAENLSVCSRIFIQDEVEQKLYWADIALPIGSSAKTPTIANLAVVPGFPKLDPSIQSIVQMQLANNLLLLGVRDNENGAVASGWVLVDTGVVAEDHGNHAHWYYDKAPHVRAQLIDDQQGNPAHVYCYGNVFYIANDAKNGFTRLDPGQITTSSSEAEIRSLAQFFSAGGEHITLAAADDIVASTWIDREGENKGRIDLVALNRAVSPSTTEAFRSVCANVGGIHGAATAGGKFFFAPSDGILWLHATPKLLDKNSKVIFSHIDLGTQAELPRRTGAFATFNDHVLFATGVGQDSYLGIIDASTPNPAAKLVLVEGAAGTRATTPFVVVSQEHAALALMFHDSAANQQNAEHSVSVIQLDPNRDGDFTDARVLKKIQVGASQVVGHSGHHGIDWDHQGKFAWISNPGDATLSILSLDKLEVVATYMVHGKPGRITSVGQRGRGISPLK